MAFEYDSGWNQIWKPNNVLDIPDFARQLVHDLWFYYDENDNVTSFEYTFNLSPKLSLWLIVWVALLLKRCMINEQMLIIFRH